MKAQENRFNVFSKNYQKGTDKGRQYHRPTYQIN